jgi:hypothetical protein
MGDYINRLPTWRIWITPLLFMMKQVLPSFTKLGLMDCKLI